MRLPWNKSNVEQLDLVGDASPESGLRFTLATSDQVAHPPARAEEPALSIDALSANGIPLRLPVDAIEEDGATAAGAVRLDDGK